ncbi:MAG: hypothetical protein HYZ85_02885 [Candidatus Omnitrophica bacterium]|nr:hypothetical protein [Candidatus Omnitrophota bacterium]
MGFLLPGIYALGHLFKSCFQDFSILLRGIFTFALGFALYGFVMMLLSFTGFYQVGVLSGLVLLLFLFSLKSWGDLREWGSEVLRFLVCDTSSFERGFAILFLVSCALTLVLNVLPETANDALCYQLHLPKLYARRHSLRPLEEELNSYMPQFWNYLYASALLFKSVFAAKLFHWMTALLLSLALMSYLNFRGVQRPWALFSGLMLLLTPTVFNQMSATYVDIAASLYLFLALIILCSNRQALSLKLHFISGIFAGIAVAIKLISLWALPFLGMILIFSGFMDKNLKSVPSRGLVFLSGFFLACGYWFLRNGLLEGNPFYPYFGHWFGTSGIHNLGAYMGYGVPKSFLNYGLLLGWMTFKPELFDRGHWIGPYYLGTLPFLFAAFRKESKLVFLWGFFFIGYSIFWFFLAQNARYFMPALVSWGVLSGVGISSFYDARRKGAVKRAMLGIAFFLSLSLFLLGIYHYRYEIFSLLQRRSSSEYLTKVERSYPIASWTNRHLPPNSKIFNAEEIRQYYFDAEIIRWNMLKIREPYRGESNPKALISEIKHRGFTHILRVKNLSSSSASEDPVLQLLDQSISQDPRVRPLITIDSENLRDDRYRYSLYEIG